MRGLEFKTLADLTAWIERRAGFHGDWQSSIVVAEELWYAEGARCSAHVYDVDLHKLADALGCYPKSD